AALIAQMLVKQRERRLMSVRQVGLVAEALIAGRSAPIPTVVLPNNAPTAAALPPAPLPVAGNLPTPATALIGREREVQELTGLLQQQRLVTLTGPGGTGKTRLSIEVAHQLQGQFPDGVWFVNLAPISDPALVLSTIAQVLGLKEAGGQLLAEL